MVLPCAGRGPHPNWHASPAESPDFFTDLVAALEGGGRGDAYGPSALRGMEDLTLANREGVVTASYLTIHFGAQIHI